MSPVLEHARRLLARARDDRYVLDRLAGDPSAPLWTLGFHAQQAVEKGLKAVLTARRIEYPRTHNLAMLVGLLEEHGLASPPDDLDYGDLVPFGVVLRYEDVGEVKGSLDRAKVADRVAAVVTWAESQVNDCESGEHEDSDG